MARKKLDKLSKDMIQCAKDGFGVHYGRWKATQEVVVPVKVDEIPKGWKICEYKLCGKPFKPKQGKRFCCDVCRVKAYYETGKPAQQMKEYREKKRAEQNL